MMLIPVSVPTAMLPSLNDAGLQYLAASDHRFFYDVCLMPSFRFTYFHSEWVNLYSGVKYELLF